MSEYFAIYFVLTCLAVSLAQATETTHAVESHQNTAAQTGKRGEEGADSYVAVPNEDGEALLEVYNQLNKELSASRSEGEVTEQTN